jgi:hypothetical protein
MARRSFGRKCFARFRAARLAKDLQLKGKRHSFPAELKLTDDWLALIGAYIAEGHSTKRFCLISAQESGWHERVKEILANLNLTFGVRLSGDFQVSSMLLTKTLSNWCGRTAFKKRLPPFWTELSNQQLSKILATYFGDGGVEAEGVFCTTASKTLADDLLWALQRFGIWARTRFRKIKSPTALLHPAGLFRLRDAITWSGSRIISVSITRRSKTTRSTSGKTARHCLQYERRFSAGFRRANKVANTTRLVSVGFSRRAQGRSKFDFDV